MTVCEKYKLCKIIAVDICFKILGFSYCGLQINIYTQILFYTTTFPWLHFTMIPTYMSIQINLGRICTLANLHSHLYFLFGCLKYLTTTLIHCIHCTKQTCTNTNILLCFHCFTFC